MSLNLMRHLEAISDVKSHLCVALLPSGIQEILANLLCAQVLPQKDVTWKTFQKFDSSTHCIEARESLLIYF